MTTRAYTDSDAMAQIRNIFGCFNKAVNQCRTFEYNGIITDFHFDLAFGKIPAIFVKFRREGEETTEIVRLEK